MLTAKQAADAVGMTKAGIIKAIQRGDLSATKDRRGSWQIDAAELFRVYPPVSRPVDAAVDAPVDSELSAVHTELAVLRERLAAKDDLLAAKDELIDELRQRVRLLTTTKPPEPAAEPQPGFWRRLFGRQQR